MALVIKDRVKETTSTSGTGTITLGGASSGFDSFSSIGDGNTTYYAIVDSATGDWEVGIGTYTATGATLSRDTVLESSNGDALVNFESNIKSVFCTLPAEKAVILDTSGDVDLGSTSSNIDMGVNTITDPKVGQWDTAYSWGNHADEGYLTSFTETDPIFVASEAYNITSADTGNWDTAYGWGDHSTEGYLTGNQSITLSGDVSGTGTTSIDVSVSDDSHNHSTSTITGLGSLATLSSVDASTITDNSVGASELNVSGNGTTSQYLRSDGDGTFSWATPTDTNTTYSAGSGLSLDGTTFSHSDTSTQASVNNSGTTFIQDVTLDTYGHVTGLTSASVTIPDAIPSGTAMLFQQTTAPTGWTKVTTHNDKALRVVSGTVSSGGTSAFSTAFGTPAVTGSVSVNGNPAVGNLAVSLSGTVGSTTLSINQVPSHTHTAYRMGNDGNYGGYIDRGAGQYANSSASNLLNPSGGSGSHNHSFSGSGSLTGEPSVGNLAGSLSSATTAINVQYVDVIIATKD